MEDNAEANGLERLRSALSEDDFAIRRYRSDLRRMIEHGAEAVFRDQVMTYDEFPDPPPEPTLAGPMTVQEMEHLLTSSLVKLSPSEMKHLRYGTYPIFRDNTRYMLRESFLFDEIPFGLKEFNREDLKHAFRVYYHDEKIDWGGLEGWDVPSTRNNDDKGLVIIDRKPGYAHCLEGRLCFIPSDEENNLFNELWDEYYESQNESEDSECANDQYDDASVDEEYDSQDECLSSCHSGPDDEEQMCEGGDDSVEADEGSESESKSESESEHSECSSSDESKAYRSFMNKRYEEKLLSDWTFFEFDERQFYHNQNQDDDVYKSASWYNSGCECNFGLINPQRGNEEDANEDERETGNTVTLFIANESMAFARGDKQQFVSLERPNNYGIECNSHYNSLYKREYFDSDYEDNDMHRMNVLQKMQAYRSTTWICKLCPTGMMLPDAVGHLIWEYWKTGPPPYLIVNEGDLILLARKKETIPDPDLPEFLQVTVTREHVVLARLYI
jgi:hypothetical protein